MARGKLRAFVQRLKDRIAFNRRTFILYSVLRALVLLTLIRCIMTQRWEGVAISVLVLVLFLVPSILEDKARIEIPGLFQAIIYTFIFAAEILGEIDHYYVLIPGWDTVLHTLNGFLCAAIGFSLVDLLNRSSKDQPFPSLRDDRCLLLLDDHRCAMGVCRVWLRHLPRNGHAEGHLCHEHLLRGA